MSKNSNFNKKTAEISDENLLPSRKDTKERRDNASQSKKELQKAPEHDNGHHEEKADAAPAAQDKGKAAAGEDHDIATLKRNTQPFKQTDKFLSEVRADFSEGSGSYIKAIDLKISALEEEIAALKLEKDRVIKLTESMKVY